MLGVFDSESLFKADKSFGPIFFSAYNIFIVLILISFLITIVTNGLEKTRKIMKLTEKEIDFFGYLKSNLKEKNLLLFENNDKNQKDLNYVEHEPDIGEANNKIDHMVNYFSNVYKNFKQI